MDETLLILGGIALNVAIGAAIGQSKGKMTYCILVSILLGPLGWILAAVTPTAHPKCPACRGDVVVGARKCKNCGSDLP
ncbi:MAG: hypothetical protein KF760_21385 [Candidatus Eremiobacteraeota bacterium]|nr:hypothetical protein [Candidatus Eremiobacteraeota bacterium]MCW5867556.1 hypothetical protein [Candidatus Eremiobacteraeota bacterium]